MVPSATGQERSLGKQRFSDAIVTEASRACVDSGNTYGKPHGFLLQPETWLMTFPEGILVGSGLPAIPGGDIDILNERQSGVKLNIIK